MNVRSLAGQLSVSIATVSRALAGQPGVATSTRERILAKAAEVGYSHNFFVSRWMARVRGAAEDAQMPGIAYVSEFSEEAHTRHLHLKRCHEGVLQSSHRAGFQVKSFYKVESAEDWMRCAEEVVKAGCAGIVLSPRIHADSRVPEDFPFAKFSWVSIGHHPNLPPMATVDHEQLLSTRAFLESLQSRGYSRIGMVSGHEHEVNYSHRRVAAYIDWQSPLPAECRIPLQRCLCDPRDPGFLREIRKWIRKHHPDAIVHPLSLGPSVCEKMGKIPFYHLGLPGVRTIKQPGYQEPNFEMGAAAASHLVSLVLQGTCGLPEHPVLIEVRGSLKPFRAKCGGERP